MSAATPGPWSAVLKNDKYGKEVLIVRESMEGGMHEIICGCIINKADVPLIAAAPDLLHALKQAHFALESLYHMGKGNRELLPYIRLNQAALKKAEGK